VFNLLLDNLTSLFGLLLLYDKFDFKIGSLRFSLDKTHLYKILYIFPRTQRDNASFVTYLHAATHDSVCVLQQTAYSNFINVDKLSDEQSVQICSYFIF